ncbi:MAG: hypothetical protein ACTHZ9_13090 [Leucobacter sp.]
MAISQRGSRRTPVFGRSALFSVLGLWGLAVIAAYVGGTTGRGLSEQATVVVLAMPVIIGIALGVVSLVRRERPGFAVAAMLIVLLTPLILFPMAMAVWAGYSP